MSTSIFFWIATLGHLFPYILYSTAGRHKAVFYHLISAFTSVAIFLATTVVALQNNLPNIELFSITQQIGVAFQSDGATLVFALLCSFLSIPATTYAISYMYITKANRKATFFARIHLSLAITMLLAFSGNLLTLFIFYELLTLATYNLVDHGNTEDTHKAAQTYLAYLTLPSVGLLLPAILITYSLSGTLTFNDGLHVTITGLPRLLLFLMFVYGIAKAAIFPLHGWLPKAMIAPTPVSALLHAVAVVKAGIFCIIKVIMYVFTVSDPLNGPLSTTLTYICSFTIIFASIVALRKRSLKEVLAYSTISQLSYIGITLSMFTQNSLNYALLYMVLHAFGKITLFFTAGAIYAKTGKTSINQLCGIGRYMPVTMIAFTIGALAMIGLPPTATLLCKADILSEAVMVNNYLLIFTLIVSTGLNCGYFLPIIFKAFFTESPVAFPTRYVLSTPLTLAYIITTVLCVVLFVYQIH